MNQIGGVMEDGVTSKKATGENRICRAEERKQANRGSREEGR